MRKKEHYHSGGGCGCGCSCAQESADDRSNAHNTHAENLADSKHEVFHIAGLDCGDCAEKLRRRIAALNGVENVSINFGAAKVYVTYKGSSSAIVQCIETAGYKIVADRTGHPDEPVRWRYEPRTVATIVSGLILLFAAAGQWFALPAQAVSAAYAVSILVGGYFTARSAWASIRSFTPDMNALMAMAVVGAVAIGEWSEAATVVFLFALGNALQAYTLDKTRRSIRSLISLAPREALIKGANGERWTAVEDIRLNDIMLVKPGERIAMDGQVTRGTSAVNQAAITGESLPVEKSAGDPVYAGTINQQGALEVRVTKLVRESTLAKIMHLVEEAQAQRAPSQQFVDRFAKYYTPAVMLLAAAITLIPWLLLQRPFDEWFYRALVLLVIACPCALVISTPVSVVAAIGSASRNGVLVKGGAHLENIGGVKALAFDKTGTLTYGRPEVKEINAFEDYQAVDILNIAASLEKLSEHPLARAIIAEAQGMPLQTVENFQMLVGAGARGDIGGQRYYIGSKRLFEGLGLDLKPYHGVIEEFVQMGKTAILLGTDRRLCGVIAVTDTIRETGGAAVDNLRSAGVATIVMLTGDNRQAAARVAEQLHIQEVYSELMPEDKVSIVQRLRQQHGSVAMVGDGVNDAPALAAANVGIAMGAAGSDSALETADIALMTDDVGKIPYIVELGKSTVAVIKQNVVFSLIVKISFILLTVGGLSNLWMAVFADTGAAVLVTLNGMRLARK